MKVVIRKFLVKYFSLSYFVNVFNSPITFLRSSTIIWSLMMISGIFSVMEWYPMLYLSLPLLILSLFIGFIYFRIYPLTDEDTVFMDEVQLSMYQGKSITGKSPYWALLVNVILSILFVISLMIK